LSAGHPSLGKELKDFPGDLPLFVAGDEPHGHRRVVGAETGRRVGTHSLVVSFVDLHAASPGDGQFSGYESDPKINGSVTFTTRSRSSGSSRRGRALAASTSAVG
jgi:hypothetical protein